MITEHILRAIASTLSAKNAEAWAKHLEAARVRWVGDDPLHVAMWLAQLAHESGEFRHVLELASGEAYEGRADLGNTQPGDGPRFKGRGLIQVTGRANYTRCGESLGLPLTMYPELLEQPEYAAQSAGWFWSWARCDELMGASDPLLVVTKRINGGTNGLESRRKYWTRAQLALRTAVGAPAPIVESTPTSSAAPAEQPDSSRRETPMAAPIVGAVAAAVVPELLKLLPWYSSGSESAERNIKAIQQIAPVIIDAAKEATGQSGVAEAATALVQANPESPARQKYVELVGAKWADIQPMLEFDERSRDRAAARAVTDKLVGEMAPQLADRAFVLYTGGIVVTSALIGLQMWLSDDHRPMGELVALLIAQVTHVATKWGTIYDYRFGSSLGSKMSGDAVRSLAETGRR